MQIHTSVPLGRLMATPNALRHVDESDIFEGLRRHAGTDWGELDPQDLSENDLALKAGNRILSAYTTGAGIRFWIITESDRSATTVLLPEDY